jgi:medium-chain acyl-[acyl-carrier-protein] hydrolase
MDRTMSRGWLCRLSKAPGTRRLLAFPYAGGGPSAFRAWVGLLPHDVELWALLPPARESRLAEPASDDLDAVVDAAAAALGELPRMPTAFFGHSLGALVAFETARALRSPQCPVALVVSGRGAPHLPSLERVLHTLPDAELLAAIREFGGTPPEVLDHAEFAELLLPAIRADFAIYERYVFRGGEPLRCPIVAVGGDADPLAPWTDVLAWERHTQAAFRAERLPGGHFFLQSSRSALLGIIDGVLSELAPIPQD